ncbi:unnamed protein product, partial [Meganyctiphanes norvegica]
CVSKPEITRCCPMGEHMINGNCVPNKNTFTPFIPILVTGPHGDKDLAGAPFPWAERSEHVEKPICEPGHLIKRVKLDAQNAYLSVMPQFVELTWHPEEGQREYKLPNEYCVDVPEDDDTYYAHFCQWDVETYCENKMCMFKCCPKGQAFSTLSHPSSKCVPSDLPFKPNFPHPPSSLITIYNTTGYGYPSCNLVDIANFSLSHDGTLIHEHISYTYLEFCMDTIERADSTDQGALLCHKDVQWSIWFYIMNKIYPVCVGMSCSFLALLLMVHAWIPKLCEKDGKYIIFHAASIFVGQCLLLFQWALNDVGYGMGRACVPYAFVLQFSFLTAYFWINTISFDTCKLFRHLVKSIALENPVEFHETPAWIYLLYAFGGPLII